MSELEPAAGTPVEPTRKSFFSKFKHQAWGWVVSALAAFFATLAPNVIRAICLTFAAAVAIATFHRTEFASRKLKRTIPAAILFILAAACLFVGAHYWDRLGEVVAEEKPNFVIESPQSGFSYDSKTDTSVILTVVTILNWGEPSVAHDWKLEITSPKLGTIRAIFTRLPKRLTGTNMHASFKDEDSIYEKTMAKNVDKVPIMGWAYFTVRGKALYDDLNAGTVRLRLICYDYKGREYASAVFAPGKEAADMRYYPGLGGELEITPAKPKRK